jgi:hypothetical protein
VKVAELRISTFKGISIGAEHWYGKLQYSEPFRSSWSSNDPTNFKTVTVERAMTAEEADVLTEKDGFGWLAGDMTSRFDTIELLDAAAIPIFEKHFDPTEDLLVRTYSSGQWQYDRHRKVLAGKPNIVAQFEALSDDREAMERLSDELGISAMMYW